VRLKLISLLLIILASSHTMASSKIDDKTGWHVGIAPFGYLQNSIQYENGVKNSSTHLSNSVFWGINFVDWLGLESTLFSSQLTEDDRNFVESAAYISLTITPKVTYHIQPKVALYFKAGYAFTGYVEEYDANLNNDEKEIWAGTLPTYGLGAEFSLFKGVKLRAGYDRLYGTLVNDDTDSGVSFSDYKVDAENYTISVHYQF